MFKMVTTLYKNGRSKIKVYWEQVRKIAAEEEITIAEARTRWREKYKKQPKKKSITTATVTSEEAAKSLICPYCRDSFKEGEEIYDCFSCSTRHHAECANEFKKCATFGCGKKVSNKKKKKRNRTISISQGRQEGIISITSVSRKNRRRRSQNGVEESRPQEEVETGASFGSALEADNWHERSHRHIWEPNISDRTNFWPLVIISVGLLFLIFMILKFALHII